MTIGRLAWNGFRRRLRLVKWILIGVLGAVGLSSCTRLNRVLNPNQPTGELPGVPAHLRVGGQDTPEDRITRVTIEDLANPTEGGVMDHLREREEDLMWTDPDNPEAGLEEMEEVMASTESRGPWRVSYAQARREAMRSGKPIVVWFTNSEFSPLCKHLSAEVFSAEGFEEWAAENVVRLRLDFDVEGVRRGDVSAMDDEVRKKNFLKALKKRYRVLGLPMVLVMSPDGTVTGRYRGYTKTYGNFYLSRMKGDVKSTKRHHEEWRERMKAKGYRVWSDRKGRTLFAKLLRYHKGQLILLEPDGRRLKAREVTLSDEDRAWIQAEKLKREEG